MDEADVHPAPISPLDEILGDKIMDTAQGTIRLNNFERFIGVSEQHIANGSELYLPTKLNDSLYVLSQVKSYTEARAFSALLKVQDSIVTGYFILDDHRLAHQSISADGMLLLCDDSRNHNLHWKSRHNVTVLSLDHGFREKWRYRPAPGIHPLRANGIWKGDSIRLHVEVITGCSICYSVVEVILDTNGTCLSANEVRLHNSNHHLDQETLSRLFLEPVQDHTDPGQGD